MMGITINQAVVAGVDEDDATTALPEGVYPNTDDDEGATAWVCPDPTRVELFRTSKRIYTAPKKANPQVVFKYLRATRKGRGDEGVAELLYEVLGDSIMDALADEKLTEQEFKEVLRVVEAHAQKATKAVLGK